MKVLIIKTSSLGDVIHTLPALSDAADAIPGIHFDWVVEEAFAEIPKWHSAVDIVIPVALRRWRKNLFAAWRSGEWKRFRERLQAGHYHCVIDAQGLLKSAWLTRYVSTPVHGLDKSSAREPFASRFYSYPHKVGKEQHAVERVRQLFALSLGYIVPESIGAFNLQRSLFSNIPVSEILQGNIEIPSLLFLHGTTWADKHWPVEYWCELATIAEASGFAVYLPWGNEEEKKRAETIARATRHCFVLPRLSLASLAAIIIRMKGVVAVDSGLGHLTAALGIPAVSLYGPTSPDKVGTYGAEQIHLTLADGDALCSRKVYPAIFSSLTPVCVWKKLSQVIFSD